MSQTLRKHANWRRVIAAVGVACGATWLPAAHADAAGLSGAGAVTFEEITPESRAAVERGLALLATMQQPDGSYGKERPIEICSEETCYERNRRAVTVIAAGAGA